MTSRVLNLNVMDSGQLDALYALTHRERGAPAAGDLGGPPQCACARLQGEKSGNQTSIH
jgi:hypothetical protein